MKTLSKYRMRIPWTNPINGLMANSYQILIWVWSGEKNQKPTEATYTIDKTNVLFETEGYTDFDIGSLVNSEIDFNPNIGDGTTQMITTDNQKWVNAYVLYDTGDVAVDVVNQFLVDELAVKGYNYSVEAVNSTIKEEGFLCPLVGYNARSVDVISIPVRSKTADNVETKKAEITGAANIGGDVWLLNVDGNPAFSSTTTTVYGSISTTPFTNDSISTVSITFPYVAGETLYFTCYFLDADTGQYVVSNTYERITS